MKKKSQKRKGLFIHIILLLITALCILGSVLASQAYLYNTPITHEQNEEEVLEFPEGFLWGAATAAYQVEGGNLSSNWYRFEQKEGAIKNNDSAEIAVDHYNLYEEDLDLMQTMNLNSYRFSLAWERIEPEKGHFDQTEMDHYKEVIQALHDRNITPLVTIWHHSLPAWFEDEGGWEKQENINFYLEYVQYVVENLNEDVELWMSMNEPMAYISCTYVSGKWAPGEPDYTKVPALLINLADAHNQAFDVIHAHDVSAQVGIAEHSSYMVPYNKYSLLENVGAYLVDRIWTHYFLNQVINNIDFIGLHYYYKQPVRLGLAFDFLTKDAEEFESNSLDRVYYPEGLYEVLMRFKEYDIPIYITELGVPDYHEVPRDQFIREHIREINYAIQDGIDVRGFYYWSLLDNFEWTEGYDAEFGLIDVNMETMERTIKDESWEYALIAGCNCVGNY